MSKGLFSWFAGLFFLLGRDRYCANLPDFTELAENNGGQHQHYPNGTRAKPLPIFRKMILSMNSSAVSCHRGPQQEYRPNHCSGFIVSADGYILTNSRGSGGRRFREALMISEYKAKVIGADRRADVALIKTKRLTYPVARRSHQAQSRRMGGYRSPLA
jgi:S1-C subfamily serine protease